MSTCPICHQQVKEEADYCKSCGASLKNVQTNNQPTRKRMKKSNRFIVIMLVVVLLLFLFTSYQLLSNKYSEESMKEQFKTAILNQDKESLKELIQPDDTRMEISNNSIDALFALIDSEQSIANDMVGNLDRANEGSFFLKKDGKHFGVFNRYIIEPREYYVTLSSYSNVKTTFYLNDQEVATLDKNEDFKEVGPFLTGSYQIKAISEKGDQEGEDMTHIKLVGNNSKSEVVLNTEITEDEEEVFNRTEENIDDNAYILSNSDSDYLDESDLHRLTSAELRIARNEIFARHGYIFETKKLQNYFTSFDWYSPNPNYDGSLSDVEQSNVELIQSLE